jgi:hypothetical protein
MGRPRGFARRSSAFEKRRAAAPALLTNSLLDIADIDSLLANGKVKLKFPSSSAFRAHELLGGLGIKNSQVGTIPL